MTDNRKAVIERMAEIAEGGTFGLFDGETVEVNVGDLRTLLTLAKQVEQLNTSSATCKQNAVSITDDVGHWRIAQINMTERPFVIIRSNGPHGDEFVATHINETDARALAALGIPTSINGAAVK